MKRIVVLVFILCMGISVNGCARFNKNRLHKYAPDADFIITGINLSKNSVQFGDDVDLNVKYKYIGGAAAYPSFVVLISLNGQTLESAQYGGRSFDKNCGPTYSCTGTIVFGEGGGSDEFNRNIYKLAKKGRNEIKVTLDPANIIPEKNKTNNELTMNFFMN